jgi:two-component system CheB/CheR fusion protein
MPAVATQRIQSFFVRHGEHHFQVSKPLRDAIVFAPQNIITDPPFSRLDLVSCRNVLIYLEPDIQAKIISLLHFALNDDGYLLLGPSETIGRATAMFESVSKKWRLYRRIGPARRDLVTIPIVTPVERTPRAGRQAEPARRRRAGFGEVMQKVLAEEFAPASALINRAYEIVSLQGPIANYLEFPSGEMTKDLLAMARQGLRTKIRVACQKAINEGRTVSERDARVRRNGDYVSCSITVRPIMEPKDAAGLLLVVMQDQPEASRIVSAANGSPEQTALVRQLESDLRGAREDLQTIVEELESSNEELKASNEEIMSMNEELQSTNEELETSKEELQALNEELTTVNAQLQDKVEELDKTNSDLTNLIAATDIATVFLDTELKIKRFTPATGRLLNLLISDVGRPLLSFAPRFLDADLLPDAERVIATLVPITKEIRADQDRWFLRRILPYRAGDDRIGGVVITFVDITEVRKLTTALERRTASLEESEHRIRAVLDAAVDAIVTIDRTGVIQMFSAGAEKMFGYAAAEAIGRDVSMLMPSPYRENHGEFLRRYHETREARVIGRTRELTARRKDGSEFPIRLSVSEIGDMGLYTGIVHDITAERDLQKEVVHIATLEQRRIGHELHDAIQQELVGLGLLAQNLSEALGAGADAQLAGKLAAGISVANQHVRELSRGLVPAAVEAAGLPAALSELAKATEQRHGIACRVETSRDLEIGNGVVATHLYRIAQEAVGNAVRHASASTISITLEGDDREGRLEIGDDGVGIQPQGERGEGLGLRIMRYRCELIGGTLSVDRRDGGGTLVICAVPRERIEQPPGPLAG